MDGLVGLLDGPRARDAFVLRTVMAPPWAVRIEDRAPLTLVAVAEGSATYRPDDDEPVTLRPGDVGLVKGPDAYTVGDRAGTQPQVRIGPDQVCSDPDGTLVAQSMALGLRSWGNASSADAPGATTMLIGTWHADGEVSRPLLATLPRLVVRRRGDWDPTLADLLLRELGRDEPGQSSVLDRLLDLVLVEVVRSWAATRPAVTRGIAPAGSRADPVVGRVLRLIHESPEQPWTLVSLAHEGGLSRAALARRFTSQVGEPVIGYLTRWRLALAADLLTGSDEPLETIARQVGYGSAFALSTAFKRAHGVSPRAHRRSVLDPSRAVPVG